MNEPLPPRKRTGCVGQGCLIVAIAAILGIGVFGVGGWWIYNNVVSRYTSDRPADVRIEQPTPDTVQRARGKLERLQSAVRNRTEATIEFSAEDLNALLASEAGFADMRGKVRVDFSGNDMILDLSVSLAKVQLPKIRSRWFNGRVQFGVTYDQDGFSFDAKSLEVGGDRMEAGSGRGVASSFLRSFSSSFTRSFNRSFHEGQNRNPGGRAFWKQIRTMSVQNGQLVVVTKAGEG